jgi:hypothetical protein
MSIWWKGPNGKKDGWHWLTIALSQARSIGLHRDDNAQHFSPKTRALRRRLWWSCVIRDTFASLAKNRIPRIRAFDFDVPQLTLQDFELGENLPMTCSTTGIQILESRQLATICIQTASICRIITEVLFALYRETSTGSIDLIYFNSSPECGVSPLDPHKFCDIEKAFERWLAEAPAEVLHISPKSSPPSKPEKALLVHRAMLSILYHTGLITLHRQKRLCRDARDLGKTDHSISRSTVRAAANQVNEILMDAYATDFVKDMPPTVISCLFPVSYSHVLDMRSENPALRREGRRRLEECKQVLRELMDAHVAAEWAVNFLTYIEARVNGLLQSPKKDSRIVSRQSYFSPEIEKLSEAGHEHPLKAHLNRQQGPSSETAMSSLDNSRRPGAVFLPTDQSAQVSSLFSPLSYSQTGETFWNDTSYTDPWLSQLDNEYGRLDMTWFTNGDMHMPKG